MNPITSVPTRRKRRYSQAERDAILQHARRMRAEGMKMAAVVSELGISTLTLSRWLKAANPAPAFLPVQVVAPDPVANVPANLTLVTPAGYRVEGLTVDALVALLGQLG